jgi:5'-methylthioadenosine phosphorylase
MIHAQTAFVQGATRISRTHTIEAGVTRFVTIRVIRVLNPGMPIVKDEPPAIGVIGGSGLYQIEELRHTTEHKIDTPFGSPSDMLVGGKLSGRQVYFLPRHGRGHRILPHEINYRANIYALRSLNVRWIISVAAVGSLQEKYAPRDVVLPSQFYDRTSQRATHTFFGEGIAAHVGFAEPISANLRNLLAESARSLGVTVHNGGTYVNMDGPAFSTRAESEFNHRNGFDVIAMTNLPEAKLAREAEIAFATMAMITDYDCWKVEEEPVSAQTVLSHLLANAETAKKMIVNVVPQIPTEPNWPEHFALDTALVTEQKLWPKETVDKLKPILERFLAK